MKILYAFQGTGNGHAARARAILPELSKYAEVHVATSGMNSELDVGFPITYRYRGLSYTANGKGRISLVRTARAFHFKQAWLDINSVPVQDYQLVVNDFEPITAYAAKRRKVPAVAISHQAAFFSNRTPRPLIKDYFAEAVFNYYAPAPDHLGFHFERYDSFILTPLLRPEIRNAYPSNRGHLTVYLPGFAESYLAPLLRRVSPKEVHLFSRFCTKQHVVDNVTVMPIAHTPFIESLISCDAFLAGAGFEGPAEALHLGKKLMVVPLGGQYEQRCNAVALARLGVPVISTVSDRTIDSIQQWAHSGEPLEINFPDILDEVIHRIMVAASR